MLEKCRSFLVLLAGVAMAACAVPAQSPQADSTVVFVLRHAEKAAGAEDPRDPDLSEDGVRRARSLALLLSHANVSHLFASEYERTRQTLRPLAEQTGREVAVISARTPNEQVTALRGLAPGSVAVVAGHSNTVPDLVKALGGEISGLVDTPRGEMLGDDEYGRLFLVVLPPGGRPGAARTLELRY